MAPKKSASKKVAASQVTQSSKIGVFPQPDSGFHFAPFYLDYCDVRLPNPGCSLICRFALTKHVLRRINAALQEEAEADLEDGGAAEFSALQWYEVQLSFVDRQAHLRSAAADPSGYGEIEVGDRSCLEFTASSAANDAAHASRRDPSCFLEIAARILRNNGVPKDPAVRNSGRFLGNFRSLEELERSFTRGDLRGNSYGLLLGSGDTSSFCGSGSAFLLSACLQPGRFVKEVQRRARWKTEFNKRCKKWQEECRRWEELEKEKGREKKEKDHGDSAAGLPDLFDADWDERAWESPATVASVRRPSFIWESGPAPACLPARLRKKCTATGGSASVAGEPMSENLQSLEQALHRSLSVFADAVSELHDRWTGKGSAFRRLCRIHGADLLGNLSVIVFDDNSWQYGSGPLPDTHVIEASWVKENLLGILALGNEVVLPGDQSKSDENSLGAAAGRTAETTTETTAETTAEATAEATAETTAPANGGIRAQVLTLSGCDVGHRKRELRIDFGDNTYIEEEDVAEINAFLRDVEMHELLDGLDLRLDNLYAKRGWQDF